LNSVEWNAALDTLPHSNRSKRNSGSWCVDVNARSSFEGSHARPEKRDRLAAGKKRVVDFK
jgi:hypothetical protein